MARQSDKKSRYFNYVLYARKLQEMDNSELQSELAWRKMLCRMAEQELRLRRQNQKKILPMKQEKE